MTRKLLVASVVLASSWLLRPDVHDVVVVDGHATRVVRSGADGLDAIARTRVAFAPADALAGCAYWDVQELCCPAGCATRRGPSWPKADDVLRGCMRGLGCPESETRSATVFMKCHCPE